MTDHDDGPSIPEALDALRRIATSTRAIAQRVGGLDPVFCFGAIIDKYVLICEEAVERGEEFRYRAPMRVGLQHMTYLAEKFARTFGPMFDGSPGALRLFVRELVRYGAPAEELDLRELGTPRRYVLSGDVQKVTDDMIDHATIVRFGGHDLVRLFSRDDSKPPREQVVALGQGDAVVRAYDLVEVAR
jgi:hypothetical protein